MAEEVAPPRGYLTMTFWRISWIRRTSFCHLDLHRLWFIWLISYKLIYCMKLSSEVESLWIHFAKGASVLESVFFCPGRSVRLEEGTINILIITMQKSRQELLREYVPSP